MKPSDKRTQKKNTVGQRCDDGDNGNENDDTGQFSEAKK